MNSKKSKNPNVCQEIWIGYKAILRTMEKMCKEGKLDEKYIIQAYNKYPYLKDKENSSKYIIV